VVVPDPIGDWMSALAPGLAQGHIPGLAQYGLVTGLRGSTANIAAFRERGPLPTSSLRAVPVADPRTGTPCV
jgi:hypothetical protein